MLKIELSKKIYEVAENSYMLDLVKEVYGDNYMSVLAFKINDKVVGLGEQFTKDCSVTPITFESAEGKNIYWHSSAHVLATAVKVLFPNAKLAIGPAIEEGFYYDFSVEIPFTEEDLAKIEAEVKKITKKKTFFAKTIVTREEAVEQAKAENEKYKVEILSSIEEGAEISMYKNGDFVDICRGPHLPSTNYIKAFKVLTSSNAYWRGDAKNDSLNRIYGISFPTKEELDSYINLKEEAKKRDHKKIGKEMGLFSFHEEGPGLPFFKKKGMIMWNLLTDYWREVHDRWDYEQIKTPIMLNRDLWETSGHWANYRENMYTLLVDEEDFAVKPMNCPGGMLVYKEDMHSYRDLPIRSAEIGLVHRHEASGALSGLFRVRAFHQDDAHIFMMPSQIKDEILEILKMAEEMYSTFGLSYHLELSTRPEKSIGSDEAWETATEGLKSALEATGRDYIINEGDGAFYGPKIDIHIKDALGRTWQCGTIQLDMNLPERFDLNYIAEDGSKKRPVMIHRVIYGSFERFFGIITEHFAGHFPLWLAPVQAVVIPVSEKYLDRAFEIANELKKDGIRVTVDTKNNRVGYKIREAEVAKIPYMMVIGDKEIEEGTVTLRRHKVGDIGSFTVKELQDKFNEEIDKKA